MTPETFERVGSGGQPAAHRSRTYEFPLKGLLFCHECGHPAVLNRKNSRGRMMCGIWFAAPTSGSQDRGCTCHSIQEQTITRAVVAKLREACRACLEPAALRCPPPGLPAELMEGKSHGEIRPAGQNRPPDHVLDRMYLDQSVAYGLAEADLHGSTGRPARRGALERRVTGWNAPGKPGGRGQGQGPGSAFLDEAGDNRELLVSLGERVELTEQRSSSSIRFAARRRRFYLWTSGCNRGARYRAAAILASARRGMSRGRDGPDGDATLTAVVPSGKSQLLGGPSAGRAADINTQWYSQLSGYRRYPATDQ